MSKRFFSRGQGLLEGIIAIGVLVTGVISVLTLSTYSLANSEDIEAKLAATNLAREALEAVRIIRDTNWLAGYTGPTGSALAWDSGLVPSSADVNDTTAVPILAADFGWTLDFVSNTATSLYRDDGVFRQYSGSVPAAVKTRFTRLLRLYAICRNLSNGSEQRDGAVCGGSTVKVGVRVVAQASWPKGTTTRSVTLEQYLYNWRFAPAQ